ncbi:hypothetical protein TNCV_4591261 [Trichonephila clavipes]|nr:hypothetical protein TNCV_4591261 [Trichonephila clavipes]
MCFCLRKPDEDVDTTLLFSHSVAQGIDNGPDPLNGLLYYNDYERKRMTRCVEVLLTAPHLALGTSGIVKP